MASPRTQDSFVGTTFKAAWQPNQHSSKARPNVKFLDPAGKVHTIGVTMHNGRQWFEHGLLQMMHFYNIQTEVEIQYTYRVLNYFHLKIRRTNGLGEIQYPQNPQVDQPIKYEP
ncbi:putative transcription factor [Sesbania bispinosa]|nr:putative transcription factor [Sesbania bispinosa]